MNQYCINFIYHYRAPNQHIILFCHKLQNSLLTCLYWLVWNWACWDAQKLTVLHGPLGIISKHTNTLERHSVFWLSHNELPKFLCCVFREMALQNQTSAYWQAMENLWWPCDNSLTLHHQLCPQGSVAVAVLEDEGSGAKRLDSEDLDSTPVPHENIFALLVVPIIVQVPLSHNPVFCVVVLTLQAQEYVAGHWRQVK